jgi:hypothetical protein
MSPVDTIMSEDREKTEREIGGPVQLLCGSVGEPNSDARPLQQPHHATGNEAGNTRPVNSMTNFRLFGPGIIHCSKQQKSRDDKDEELRLAQVDIKARLDKVNSDLRELKARLKAKEEHVRARRNLSKHARAAEKELNVKIEKAKEELRAKEEQAAVRRAKKDGMREKWALKQKADFEEREARRTERSRHDAEADDGMKPVSVGAAMAPAYEGDFDIDIYGD